MDFEPLNSKPIDPHVIDAASGSVFTGERKDVSHWMPKWGGRFSRLDVIFLGVIAAVVLVVVALLLLQGGHKFGCYRAGAELEFYS